MHVLLKFDALIFIAHKNQISHSIYIIKFLVLPILFWTKIHSPTGAHSSSYHLHDYIWFSTEIFFLENPIFVFIVLEEIFI